MAALSTVGAALGVAIAGRMHPSALAVACLVLLAVALPLSTIDVATRRLPDKVVLPALAGCAGLLAIAAGTAGAYGQLWRALAAAAVVFLAFTALALIIMGGLGFGDCKVAALCALPLGYLGWTHVLHGVIAAYLLAALYVLGRRLAGRTSRHIAFGPFLFSGALLVLAAV
ncbi:prepilin peptidase [Actinospica sp. MGRD01-02]|uniref:Prepilin peptidase n=1 Tax=Actinospica acidithermotolerans TaxID=2828514 RepID=A0A941E7L7_9ACTN|nr:prepilin peptidase [Actinospica acidithermotolerans]MBR7827825.1 prepilin peptidase [Actinospica acidithermotolerans]